MDGLDHHQASLKITTIVWHSTIHFHSNGIHLSHNKVAIKALKADSWRSGRPILQFQQRVSSSLFVLVPQKISKDYIYSYQGYKWFKFTNRSFAKNEKYILGFQAYLIAGISYIVGRPPLMDGLTIDSSHEQKFSVYSYIILAKFWCLLSNPIYGTNTLLKYFWFLTRVFWKNPKFQISY